MPKAKSNKYDIFIIGGGVNGVGIARDAAGRGLKVCLADMGDLGGATSSSSTKLFHGGLRYLEYFEFNLVRESLREREVLLSSMPHISWPMRFVLPYHEHMRFETNSPVSKVLSFLMPWYKGKRPPWLIKLALFLYDNIGGRKILPESKTINLKSDPSGQPLKEKFVKAFEYSDCWVEDSRLVILNARDAAMKSAEIMPRNKVISAKKIISGWEIIVKNSQSNKTSKFSCKLLINASGPWVQSIINNTLTLNSSLSVRLVKGSHIVTKKLFKHEKCYFFQGTDGRIVFAIPYETDFTLIGTTDVSHENIDDTISCSTEEEDYLLTFVNEYFEKPVTKNDIIWSYAGVRPLFNDGSESDSAISRDYFLDLDQSDERSPLMNIYGGKITTYRKLAESALDKVQTIFPEMGPSWTEKSYLPGGAFEIDEFEIIVETIFKQYGYLGKDLARRLVRLYGKDAYNLLANKTNKSDLGQHFGNFVYAFEIDWTIKHEWVTCSEDFLWRRTKLGLLLDNASAKSVDKYIKKKLETIPDL